ncbi:MAG: PQQ-like beta-propeller repeat protein [Acidobacteria bacterium]|nr:PQQ-like beta-propeller repeat protein [Acidobacteriota bacterium]
MHTILLWFDVALSINAATGNYFLRENAQSMVLNHRNWKSAITATLFLFACVVAAYTDVAAQDAAQWRGPNRDGVITGFRPPQKWPAQLKQVWKIQVGEGHSTPVVVAGRVYVIARQGETEVVAAYDLANGKQIWKNGYAVAYQMNPAAMGHGKGPKSTPVLADGRLYTLGITGVLSCFDAASGALKWRKDFAGQFKQTAPLFGTAMSPVVDRGLLIVHAGGHDDGALFAFDAATGAVKWKWTGDGPGYASPVVAELGGVRQIITQSQANLIGVAAANGALLWKVPFTTEYHQNIVTPILVGDLVIMSGINKGVTAYRPVKKGLGWSADVVWENKEVSMYMNSPVLRGNMLFGLSHRNKGQYFCLDAATGKTLWTSDGRQGDNASMLLAGDLILSLNSDADLTVLPTSAKIPQHLARYKVADSPTWAHPVIIGNRILVKDAQSLALWSVE